MSEPRLVSTDNDKRSSIELARNAKGEWSYHVKLYFDDDPDGIEMRRAMSRVQELAGELDERYMRGQQEGDSSGR